MKQDSLTMLSQFTRGLSFGVLALFFAVSGVHAQGMPDLASLTQSTTSTDWSIGMWRMLFGEFVDNPFSTLGGPTTLLGGIFIVLNGVVFVLGFSWALFGIMSAVVSTAHEGEVLGRRMSTIWFPIRMFIGMAGMVPLFGGFTLMQAIMMFLTVLGIGIGNSLFTTAVNNTSQMQGLLNTTTMSPTYASKMREAARSMFVSNVCVLAQGEHEAQVGIVGAGDRVRVSAVDASDRNGRQHSSIQYGTPNNPTACGFVSAVANVRSGNNPLAFRTNAVDYAQIESGATAAYASSMRMMQNEIAMIATRWYDDRNASLNSGNGDPAPVPLDELDRAVDTFNRTALQAIQNYNVDGGAITAAVKQNMLAVGWFGLGAWFSTFAEVNAGIADATKGPDVEVKGPQMLRMSTVTADAINAVQTSYKQAQASRSGGGDNDGGSKALLDSAIADSCSSMGVMSGVMGTATGNCSIGQAIVSSAIRATAIGSGGGGNGSGSLALDSQGLVNPIIMMKNMGDYVMTFSSTIILGDWLGGKVMGVVEWFASKSPAGLAANVASKMGSKATEGESKPSSFWDVIKLIAMFSLVLGAAMSIYIPLIPFITWIGAILAYAASMIEGFAGATLHAFSHLEADGDGLGQRTTHGYMFYINAVIRPALMVIGFFFASAIMIAIGTLQAQMFLPAMANVQGNSVTGLSSVVMFLVVFFVMNMTLVTASFNLIYVITDQVIGFVGGQIDSKLGRDTEDKVNNMFLMAARVGPSAIGQANATAARGRELLTRGAGKGKDQGKPE
jgi:conjugal transfer/type IV secretion protein DotA/TraY